MKKIIEDLARKSGIETGYAGSTRTMYIKGPNLEKFRERIRNLYPDLPFQLKPAENLLEVPATPVPEKKTKVKKTFEEMSPVTQGLMQVVDDVNDLLPEVTFTEASSREGAVQLRNKVDAYLIANPLDRTTKDPYGAVAKLFNVKNDYVRGRYRALREKGLVEKQNETNESRS